MLTFRHYLDRARPLDPPARDFIEDARADRRFPSSVTCWLTLANYLRSRRACPEAIRAAKRVWRNYERAQARRR